VVQGNSHGGSVAPFLLFAHSILHVVIHVRIATIIVYANLSLMRPRRSPPAPNVTSAALAPVGPASTSLAAFPKEEVEAADSFAKKSKAVSTRRVYRGDWKRFLEWCDDRGATPLPAAPEVVSIYLAYLAKNHLPRTIGRAACAISYAHSLARQPIPTADPRVRATLAGIRREIGMETRHRKDPVHSEELFELVRGLSNTLRDCRDRAIILVGFGGAFRRSELVALDVGDIKDQEDGILVRIKRSKTDQEGRGQEVAIPEGVRAATCPVRALRAWLKLAAIEDGPIFRPIHRLGRVLPKRLRPHNVAEIVKAAAERCGLDPTKYAGHSLRSGLATSAAEHGANEFMIRQQTRHKDMRMVAEYVRVANLLKNNAAKGLF
jgi:integrase